MKNLIITLLLLLSTVSSTFAKEPCPCPETKKATTSAPRVAPKNVGRNLNTGQYMSLKVPSPVVVTKYDTLRIVTERVVSSEKKCNNGFFSSTGGKLLIGAAILGGGIAIGHAIDKDVTEYNSYTTVNAPKCPKPPKKKPCK